MDEIFALLVKNWRGINPIKECEKPDESKTRIFAISPARLKFPHGISGIQLFLYECTDLLKPRNLLYIALNISFI